MEVLKPWALNKEASLGSSVKEFRIQELRWRGQDLVQAKGRFLSLAFSSCGLYSYGPEERKL